MTKAIYLKNLGYALIRETVDPKKVKDGTLYAVTRTTRDDQEYTVYEAMKPMIVDRVPYKYIAVPTRFYDPGHCWILDGIRMKMVDNAYPVNHGGNVRYETTMEDEAGGRWMVAWDLFNPDEDLSVYTDYEIFDWADPVEWKRKKGN